MGIALTDNHRELAEVARAFLISQQVRWAARSLLDTPDEVRPAFWHDMVELGWPGLHVDEKYGGSGYGLPELVVVIEELGRAVAPGPFVPTVIASAVIANDGTAGHKARLLSGLIDGSVTAGIGLYGQVRVKDGGTADGEAGIVLGAGLAELLLVAAGDDMLVLERDRAGVVGGHDRKISIRLGAAGASGYTTLASPPTTFCLGHGNRCWLGRALCWLPRRWAEHPTVSTLPSGMPSCVSNLAAPSPRSRRSSIIARTCWWSPSRRSPRSGMPHEIGRAHV